MIAQRAYYGRDSEISRVEAGFVSPDMDLTNPVVKRIAYSCVSARFRNPRVTVGAATAIWPGGRIPCETSVDERSDVYYGESFGASTILHEALNSLLGMTDPQSADRLKIKLPANGDTSIISDELHKNDCGGD